MEEEAEGEPEDHKACIILTLRIWRTSSPTSSVVQEAWEVEEVSEEVADEVEITMRPSPRPFQLKLNCSSVRP